MATWSTPITAGTDLRDLALAQMLVAAANERAIAVHGSGATQKPTPAAGDVIQSTSWFYLGDGSGLQEFLGPTNWVNHTLTFEGNTDATLFSDDCFWTLPGLRAAAGLPTTLYYANGTRDSSQDNLMFRRLRPREILSAADTADTQGNPAIAGQVAYMVGDGPPAAGSPGGAAYGSLGVKYQCVSSARWQVACGVGVDILDNTLTQPNSISESNTHYSTAGGAANYGDCFGAHLFEECRAILDLMRWTTLSMGVAGGFMENAGGINTTTILAGASNSVFSGFMSSEPAAEAAVVAAWPTAAPPPSGNYAPFALYVIDYNGTDYFCSASRADLTIQVQFDNSTIARKHDWYSLAAPPASAPFSLSLTFDGQTDGVVNGQWHNWYAGAATSAATADLPQFGDATVLPSTPSPPGSFGDTRQGYSVIGMAAILKWNVAAGGFAYCTATV